MIHNKYNNVNQGKRKTDENCSDYSSIILAQTAWHSQNDRIKNFDRVRRFFEDSSVSDQAQCSCKPESSDQVIGNNDPDQRKKERNVHAAWAHKRAVPQ